MAQWIPVGWDFDGSTEGIRRLRGKRVRTKGALHGAVVYDPVNTGQQQNFDVAAHTVGFVANPHPNMQDLLIAVPTAPNTLANSLDSLARSNAFKVVVVNAPTFRLQFEFEA
jgi:hypothetical protein